MEPAPLLLSLSLFGWLVAGTGCLLSPRLGILSLFASFASVP